MIAQTSSIVQGSNDVFALEIRQFDEDLVVRQASSQQIQYINHANAHATDTRAAATLTGRTRDTR